MGPLREAQMIEPIQQLMLGAMRLDVIAREFSAGYGVADLVGARISPDGWESRLGSPFSMPFDHQHLVEVLLALKPGVRTSLIKLARQVSFAESTLIKKVLPQLIAYGLIEKDTKGYVRLLTKLPQPTDFIVAVEAKQTNWREAILQARRYSFFAHQTYIAIWYKAAQQVDLAVLDRHHIGLIGVGLDSARILMQAPICKPRHLSMNHYCAEFLYGKALSGGSNEIRM